MSFGPLLVSLSAVGLGASLGLAQGPKGVWLAPVRTFGLVSVLGLVLLLLLPDALSALGWIALPIVAAGLLLPTALDRLQGTVSGEHRRLGIELGYFAVLVHQFCDGIGLASESAWVHGVDHWDALIAMSVHTIPLTTLVVVSFSMWHGWRAALLRAVGIALATLGGIAVIRAIPAASVDTWHPWIAAGVSGMLLHIISNGPQSSPQGIRGRSLDALATVAGFALIGFGLLGAHSHSEAGHAFGTRLLDAFVGLGLTSAPALLLGLTAGAAIAAFGAPIPTRWLATKHRWLDAGRGAFLGAPLPVCSCGVLPVTQGLRTRGASTAFVLAFLVATPEIGIDAFALSTQFLGWQFTLVRVVTALVLAIAAAVIGARILASSRRSQREAATVHGSCCGNSEHNHGHDHGHEPPQGWPRRFVHELDELVFHIGPWALLGLLVAAYTEAMLPEGIAIAALPAGLDILVISVLAIPSYVCASSMTPLAAVLLAKGFSPGAVLAGLLLGPATNVATFGFVRGELGRRGMTIWLGCVIAMTWVMATGVNIAISNGVLPAPEAKTGMAHDHGTSWWMVATAVGFTALIARGVWRVGFARWLASLGSFMTLSRAKAPASVVDG